jgi:hypothetical protein
MPVSPGTGEINTACPFPDSGPAIPIPPRTHSLLGLSSPPDQHNSICDRTARHPTRPDFFSLPAPLKLQRGSSLEVRYRSGGRLFLKPLGTKLIISLVSI